MRRARISYEGKIAMSLNAAKIAGLAACIAALALSACTQSRLRMSPDFGDAVTLDERAQIADPDARYTGTPAPGSNGQRVGLAQKRYDKNEVIPPSATGASSSNSINNTGANNNGSPPGGSDATTSSGP
jgi:hypothetical protein